MITAENLSVHFTKKLFAEKIKALDGLNLEVKKGDFFALVGQNGAGKSTAMYSFLGLVHPTYGKVTVFGEEPYLGSPIYNKIAYIPEEPHYHNYLTIEEAVYYYANLYNEKFTKQQVNNALEKLGLAEHKQLKVSKCSKGMKQKMGIAQCLIHDTELLFLDEPTRGLDPIAVKEFRDVLVELHKKGTTIVMNSHVLSEIEMIATSVAIIERGRLVVQNEINNLLRPEKELYEVIFEETAKTPKYISITSAENKIIKGTIPVGELYVFMTYIKKSKLMLYSCAIKKNTLEESFFKIIKGGN